MSGGEGMGWGGVCYQNGGCSPKIRRTGHRAVLLGSETSEYVEVF